MQKQRTTRPNTLKRTIKKLAAGQPEFIIGKEYEPVVNKKDPDILFIKGLDAAAREAIWFIFGGAALLMGFLFDIAGRLFGKWPSA